MTQAIRVKSRFATPRDTARILGVSKSRTDDLIKRVKQMLLRDSTTGEFTTVRAKGKAETTVRTKSGRLNARTKTYKTRSKSSKARS